MCFGVKDALNVMRDLENPQEVTVYGELVHNPVVTAEISQRGFHQQAETGRGKLPETRGVLVTAHGISLATRQRLEAAGKTLHDTTCPLVRRVHKTALHYHKLGYTVIVVGRPGHVEVEGLVGDLTRYRVVSCPEDVESWPSATPLAVVNQTTITPDQVKAVHQAIRLANPGHEVVFADTVCGPTKDRQKAVEALLDRVEALVVVGGPNSHNTLQLGEKAERRGKPWWRVTTAEDLREEWFAGLRLVGLTAGTSTTDETVAEVHRRLRALPSVERKKVSTPRHPAAGPCLATA
jgi:4-hydroxy-3-methylbut-2-enyl diphosphate reductase